MAVKKMTKAHKEALAVGRNEGRIVRHYLEALDAHKPKRGRKRTPESIAKRLDVIESSIEFADRLTALKLAQERIDLQVELEAMSVGEDLGELETEFVAIAASYSARQSISYSAWREIGVPAAALRQAGVTRAG
jgi:hypothetical protein